MGGLSEQAAATAQWKSSTAPFKGSTQHPRRQPQRSGSGRAWVSSTVCVYIGKASPRDTFRVSCELSQSFQDGSVRWSRSQRDEVAPLAAQRVQAGCCYIPRWAPNKQTMSAHAVRVSNASTLPMHRKYVWSSHTFSSPSIPARLLMQPKGQHLDGLQANLSGDVQALGGEPPLRPAILAR